MIWRIPVPLLNVSVFALAVAAAPMTPLAQPAPFSMEPERYQQLESGGGPGGEVPSGAAGREDAGASSMTPSPEMTAAGGLPLPGADQDNARHYIVPDQQLQLRGEIDRRSWSVVLTRAQAASPASLTLGYQNSVFVAPEFSELSLSVNGEPILRETISSPDTPRNLRAEIPAGLLQAGRNTFDLSARQRHRTDCSVESTFQLWTDIKTADSFLSFEDPAANRFGEIADLAAIGNDPQGLTEIVIVAPGLDEAGYRDALFQLTQTIALIIDMPRPSVSVTSSPKGTPAELTVYFGTDAQLAPFEELSGSLGSAPSAGFVDSPSDGRQFLLVTGGTLAELEEAVNRIGAVAAQVNDDREAGSLRTQNRFAPAPPLIETARRFALSDVGIPTQEFSGRLFRAQFEFGLPADFYADAYGYFQILLDAAYAPSVRPGSALSIYVNGNIAANVPINQVGGSIMNKFPVSVPMRNARPGLNTVTIEGRFDTAEDAACAAGTTGTADRRFVLFDTSQVVFPAFGRIAQLPNLASFSGFAYPYSARDDATRLFLPDFGDLTLSAATTVIANLAVAAGRPLAIDSGTSAPITAQDSAILIGSISDLPSQALAYVGLEGAADTDWAHSAGRPADNRGLTLDNRETLESWRNRLAEEGWHGRFMRFMRDMQRSFNISEQNLALRPPAQGSYTPPPGTNVLVAQNAAGGVPVAWTVLTAPDGQSLEQSMDAFLTYSDRLNGSVSAIQAGLGEVVSVRHERTTLIATEPLGFSNLRLVLANWLSINALVFCMVLFAVIVLFGMAVSGLLKVSGRRS
ncbi:cellulose synthase BcsB subunit [Roseibium aquae]|uniref:Cyclic di-GMP-binding protein n=1 Tax=Roseibium aquae TaxID=1323746 RepID=A0A916WYU6_9HYPH|nr:cellulose biosynthesis cyclic di-GMP-binding regulatory protein BcsB [Roseibium aquae]GGB41316.1 cellulose synthase BcsB subunit [Roseibium aquae]